MKDSNVKYVVCPCCGAEYHPAEIFMPQTLLGRPKVVRDSVGHIVSWTGDPVCLREKYICDYCDSPLDVQMKLDYRTSYNKKMDTRMPYTTQINHPRFTLSEND